MSILFVFSVAVTVIGLTCGLLVLWKVPVLDSDARLTGTSRSSVTIIIPARNEEKRMLPLLESISAQRGIEVETIVVDDHSTDRTAEVAYSYGARVLPNERFDKGWIGKSSACWTGAEAATGELLLFMDADTVFEGPDSLVTYVASFEESGGTGILSLQPDHRPERWYEQIASIFPVVVMAGMNVFTVKGDSLKSAGSFGPCMLCTKAEYMEVGGHAAVKGAVMDDLALGNEFQDKGLPVTCMSGRGVAWLRMYPEGFGQLIQGYSKSMASGSVSTLPSVMLLINLWVVGGILSSLLFLFPVITKSWLQLVIAVMLYVAYMWGVARSVRKTGVFANWTIPMFPLLFIFFILVFMYSMYLSKRRKRVTWRGRDIDV